LEELFIKNMTIKDKSSVIEIVKDIWEGGDYIPLVYDSWVKDRKGRFIGAFDRKGKLIGFEKLTMFSDYDAWIEGLRKDLKSGIKGVGKFLSMDLLKTLKNNSKIKTIRFATYFKNDESIALFTKLGFRILEKRDHKFLRLPKLKKIPEYRNNRAEVIIDKKAVLDFIKKSRWKSINKNGFCHSWVVRPFDDDLFVEEYIKKGHCIAIRENSRVKALCLYTVREKEDLFISFFEAEDDKLSKELLQKVKKTAYINGQLSMCVVINRKDKLSYNNFKINNFKSWEKEGDFLIFDLPLKVLKNI
jgi:hypothetical protein